MLIVNYLLKSEFRICCKYFTRSITQRPAITSSLRCCPYYARIDVRFNHDRNFPASQAKQLENEYYHSYLAQNKKYVASIAFLDYVPEGSSSDVDSVLNESFEDQNGVRLIAYLYTVLKHSPESVAVYNDERFIKLCETLSSKISSLNEDQMINMLKVLTHWDESKRNEIFFDLCRTVDRKLLQRYKLWGFDRCLLIMDHFYRLHVLRYSETVWNCMKRLWRDPNRLTSTQAVHAMFLVNAHRVWHPAVHMFSVEGYLQQVVYELGVEECAIMALSFFKTQHRIKNVDLLKLLYQKLFYRLSNLDSIPLAAFLKLFRFCHFYRLEEEMQQLLGLLNGVAEKHDFLGCTHMALLGTGGLIRNTSLLEKIAQRLIREVSTVRIKDIERTMLAFETFNYESKTEPDVYEVVLQELLKRKNSIFEYPRPFYSAVTYLSLKGYYNFDLVDFLLSEDTIKKAFHRKELSHYNCHINLLTISDGIKIDFPEYSGNLLKESLRKDLCLSQSWKIPKDSRKIKSMYDKILLQTKSVLQDIFGGPDFVHYTYVLPHLPRPDVIFCLKEDTPVKLSEDILSNNFLEAGIPSKTEDWYVITCLGTYTVIHGTDEPIGNSVAKLRQLRKIGYKVLCVKEKDWFDRSSVWKNHLQQLIKDAKQANLPEVPQPIRVELR